MLARVRALLAKAESTEFEEEAEALTAKAQELIARHAIAEALLHTPDDVGDPLLRRILLNDPYIDAKAALLSRIAAANRCRAVYTAACGWVTVFGYNQDLNAVELLTASLLTQATSVMARHGSRRDALVSPLVPAGIRQPDRRAAEPRDRRPGGRGRGLAAQSAPARAGSA